MYNSFQIDGEILCIDKTRPAKEGSNMMLRNFILKKPNAGEVNDLTMQCKGNNTSLLDGYLPGDKVIVTFSLSGTFGGAKYKEGNVKCDTNPDGLSSFSPNINVFEICFVQGFIRQQKPAAMPNKQQQWDEQNKPVSNPVLNQNPGSIDDLPF